MSFNIYPPRPQVVTVSGTTKTQDLTQQSLNSRILKELKKMNFYNALAADTVIDNSEVS